MSAGSGSGSKESVNRPSFGSCGIGPQLKPTVQTSRPPMRLGSLTRTLLTKSQGDGTSEGMFPRTGMILPSMNEKTVENVAKMTEIEFASPDDAGSDTKSRGSSTGSTLSLTGKVSPGSKENASPGDFLQLGVILEERLSALSMSTDTSIAEKSAVVSMSIEENSFTDPLPKSKAKELNSVTSTARNRSSYTPQSSSTAIAAVIPPPRPISSIEPVFQRPNVNKVGVIDPRLQLQAKGPMVVPSTPLGIKPPLYAIGPQQLQSHEPVTPVSDGFMSTPASKPIQNKRSTPVSSAPRIFGTGTPMLKKEEAQDHVFQLPNSANKPKVKKPTGWKFASETVDIKEYLIIKSLGKGGCGEVSLVIEKDSRQLYALKKVNLAGVDDQGVQECINEVRMLIELRDTDLVIHIYSWEMNQTDKTMKIIMEYGHCDLSQSIKIESLSLLKLKARWERMLMIVNTLHKRGIVHADLKPANFVWVGDNLKIIDFGIANRLQNDNTSIAMLNPKGTLNFISPETIRQDAFGRTKISPKSDIWSLGCILYLMIYGKTPFQDITHTTSKMTAIISGTVNYPPLPDSLRDSSILSVLQLCFTVDSKQRPSAEELLRHSFLR